MRQLVLVCLLGFGFTNAVCGQAFSRYWFGRAEAKTALMANTYLCGLELKKQGNRFTGELSYFFGSNDFKTQVSGKYWPATKTFELDPFPVITYFSSGKNAPDCFMDGSLTLYIDGNDSVLYGQFNPIAKYRNSCPVMTISLSKEVPQVEEIEIAPEPEADSLSRTFAPQIAVETTNKKVDNQNTVIPVRQADVPVLVKELNKRVFTEGPLIIVETDSIELHLYDNGKIDNDSVSVFFNRAPVLQNQPLKLTPIIIRLGLQPGENEIALFAENLGDIPPNTALCIIYAGDKRFDINLSSTLVSNGTVRIKKQVDTK